MNKETVNITNYFQLRRPPNGDIGIEVECEGYFKILTEDPYYWALHHDPSLINGLEFVLAKPIKADVLNEALAEFSHLVSPPTDIRYSPRTSVHIHINCCNFTIEQIYNIIAHYWLFENIFLKMNGKDREGNIFCLRSSDAEYFNNSILMSAKDFDLNMLVGDQFRYSSLNLCSLAKFGSVEFRFIKGTVDTSIIKMWALNLNRFVQLTRLTPITHLVNQIDTVSFEEILKTFFTEDFIKAIYKSCGTDLEKYYISNLGRILELKYELTKPLVINNYNDPDYEDGYYPDYEKEQINVA